MPNQNSVILNCLVVDDESMGRKLIESYISQVPFLKFVDAAKNGKFLSKDDFRDRTKVSKTVIDLMDDLGIFGDIPQSNQFSLFDGVIA